MVRDESNLKDTREEVGAATQGEMVAAWIRVLEVKVVRSEGDCGHTHITFLIEEKLFIRFKGDQACSPPLR